MIYKSVTIIRYRMAVPTNMFLTYLSYTFISQDSERQLFSKRNDFCHLQHYPASNIPWNLNSWKSCHANILNVSLSLFADISDTILVERAMNDLSQLWVLFL